MAAADVPQPFERLDFLYMPSTDVAADLEQALDDLERRGWTREPSFGIPHGPCCSFRTPGGHRVAIYELTRPGADERFAGRRDF